MDELQEWQNRLEGHFSQLSEARASIGYPIFALEHGLSEREVNNICDKLRTNLKSHSPSTKYWLLWVIYATELGYSYEGDEYWQTFDRATPEWSNSYRDYISKSFARFAKQYNGVVPTGRWANQFRIISWPITHAVLPRYLQIQFARVLYDLRFNLAELPEKTPTTLGNLIAINASYASNRFQEFVEQESLVGRIAIALLYGYDASVNDLLLNSALERIVSDLQRIRNGRIWLNEATRVVKPRFRGARLEHKKTGSIETKKHNERILEKKGPLIEPRFTLRNSASNEWKLVVEIPNFSEIAKLDQETEHFLQTSKVSINGATGKKPPAWLLFGNPTAVLDEWPDPSIPIVQFENKNAFLENFLENECRIDDRSTWLFWINADGLAIYIKNLIIKPNNQYIVVTNNESAQSIEGGEECNLTFSGIRGFRLNVPKTINKQYREFLYEIGLCIAENTEIWPVGMPGRNWDNQGHCELLTTEEGCFGIRSDFSVDSYLVTLGKEMGEVIDNPEIDKPVFVQLPKLDPGQYTLRVVPRRGKKPKTMQTMEEEAGVIEIKVREPNPWIAGASSHAGLVIRKEPYHSSLEDLVQDEISISVFGPPGRFVRPYISLENAKGEELFRGDVSEAIELPVDKSAWKSALSQFLKCRKEEIGNPEISRAIVRLEAYELGVYMMAFESNTLPLRWSFHEYNGSLHIRLVNDSDNGKSVDVCQMARINSPYKFEDIDLSKVYQGIEVAVPGALYSVDDGEFRDVVLVSNGVSGKGLSALGGVPDLSNTKFNGNEILNILEAISIWRSSRLFGFLAKIRRKKVVQSLEDKAIYTLFGEKWLYIEKKMHEDEIKWSHAINELIALVHNKSGFPVVLERDARVYAEEGGDDYEISFVRTTNKFGVCSDDNLSKAALKLANIEEFGLVNNFKLKSGVVNKILNNSTLIRGARLFILLVAYNDESQNVWADDKTG